MKKIFYFSIVTFFILNCVNDSNSVKVTNNLSETLIRVEIGNVVLSNIAQGATTEESELKSGTYNIKGTTASGNVIQKEETMAGRFLNFIVTFENSGTVTVSR